MRVTLKVAKLKGVEFANSVDPDEAAHNEPLHLYPVLQVRRGKRDILDINFHISPLKPML